MKGHPLSAVRRPTVTIPGQFEGYACKARSQESLRNGDNLSCDAWGLRTSVPKSWCPKRNTHSTVIVKMITPVGPSKPTDEITNSDNCHPHTNVLKCLLQRTAPPSGEEGPVLLPQQI